MKKIIFLVPAAFLITPSLVFASWWNPFTWSFFNHSNTLNTNIEIPAQNIPVPVQKPIRQNVVSPITTSHSAPPKTVSVSGMQQYTDSNFGFSFWYPSNWTIQQPSSSQYIAISGGTINRTIVIGPTNDPSNSIAIQQFASSGMGITDSSAAGPAGNGSLSLTYFFNPSIHTWMMQDTDGENNTTTVAANVSTNTMGGLHILRGNARFGDDYIIPLSAEHFLVVSSVGAGTIQEAWLAKTITAADPSIATPVSAAAQAKIIHTEGLLYHALGTAIYNSVWYIDGQYVYDAQGNIMTGANPATFRGINTYSDGFTETTGTVFATDGIHVYNDGTGGGVVLQDADPATFTLIRQQYQVPYKNQPGSATEYNTTYEKDKSHVWDGAKLIPSADPNTFVVTGNDLTSNGSDGYTLAHDAHNVYGEDAKGNVTVEPIIVAPAGTTGTLQGKATIASDCNIPSCSQTNISSLGILIRQPTTTLQSDGSMAVTIQDVKFKSDGTYSVSLPPGTYYIYEDNNNWYNTSLTAGFSGQISNEKVTIKAGSVTSMNLSIDNVKPGLPL